METYFFTVLEVFRDLPGSAGQLEESWSNLTQVLLPVLESLCRRPYIDRRRDGDVEGTQDSGFKTGTTLLMLQLTSEAKLQGTVARVNLQHKADTEAVE